MGGLADTKLSTITRKLSKLPRRSGRCGAAPIMLAKFRKPYYFVSHLSHVVELRADTPLSRLRRKV